MENIKNILNECHSYTKKSNVNLNSKYIYGESTLVYEKVFTKGQSNKGRILVTNDKLYKKINDLSEEIILLRKDDKLDVNNEDTVLEMNLVNTSILSINTNIPITAIKLNEVLKRILLDGEKITMNIFINGINKSWIKTRMSDYKTLKEDGISKSRRYSITQYPIYGMKNVLAYSNLFYKRYINKTFHNTNIEFIDKNSKQKYKGLLFDTNIRFIVKGLSKERKQVINNSIKKHISMLNADNRFIIKEKKVNSIIDGENQKEYLERVKNREKSFHLGDLNALSIKEIQSLMQVLE